MARLPGGERVELPYDELVVAAGVRQSYFGHDEFARWAPGMKTIDDALAIRRRIFGAFERAETTDDPDERRRLLTFAVVGAGPTGVELAGQIRELAVRTLHAEFRNIRPEDARVLLFDGGSAALASFGPALSRSAEKTLGDLGVELHLGSIVTDVDAGGLRVRDATGTTVDHPAAHRPVGRGRGGATGRRRARDDDRSRGRPCGRILVGPDLTVPGHPEISVVGDLMSRPGLPGVAEVAMQAGFYTGRRLRKQVEGKRRPGRFRYIDLGSAAYIARGRAVVSAGPVHVSGLPGWLVWLFIHIAFLTGFRSRVGALLTWAVAFTREARRERTLTAESRRAGRDAVTTPTTAGGA